MTCTPSPRPPSSEWLTNLILRNATAFIYSPLTRSTNPTEFYLSCLRRLEAAAEKQLPDAWISEDLFRAIRDACAAQFEHDAII